MYQLFTSGPLSSTFSFIHGRRDVTTSLLQLQEEVNGTTDKLFCDWVRLDEIWEMQKHLQNGGQAMGSTYMKQRNGNINFAKLSFLIYYHGHYCFLIQISNCRQLQVNL